MTQSKIDLKKLRSECETDKNEFHPPATILALIEALDETRAALEFDMPMDGEDGSCSWCGTGGIDGYQHTVDCPFRRAQEAIAKLEEKFA